MGTEKWFVVGFLLIGSIASAQTEADFNVGLTDDNTGAVITKYTGNVATVRIPGTIQGMPVREISITAFSRNSTITSVVIPDGVTEIRGGNNPYEGGAFFNCDKLVSITFPSTLKKIGGFAFGGCFSLREAIIPEGVTEIGKNAFASCRSLAKVSLPSTLKHLGEWAFGNADGIFGRGNNVIFTSIILPENLKSIEEGVFYGCKNLTSIIIPEGITKIGRQAFDSCVALTSVRLPLTIERIDEYAFYGCTELTVVTIPTSLVSVVFGGRSIDYQNVFEGNGKINLISQVALKRIGYTGRF
ncbi:MAG: leucine-rich repeat domain-containing protein [Treponema sp.]|jgi:hypothetical protein|nr:leucine-rich repeat domain-containing protein [Treponema sp.]